MSGFQAVKGTLHAIKQPQSLERKVLQIFQQKSRPAGRHKYVSKIRSQETQRD